MKSTRHLQRGSARTRASGAPPWAFSGESVNECEICMGLPRALPGHVEKPTPTGGAIVGTVLATFVPSHDEERLSLRDDRLRVRQGSRLAYPAAHALHRRGGRHRPPAPAPVHW